MKVLSFYALEEQNKYGKKKKKEHNPFLNTVRKRKRTKKKNEKSWVFDLSGCLWCSFTHERMLVDISDRDGFLANRAQESQRRNFAVDAFHFHFPLLLFFVILRLGSQIAVGKLSFVCPKIGRLLFCQRVLPFTIWGNEIRFLVF
jgi:hypothetical protein